MLAYGDVLLLAPPMVKELNDHLSQHRGGPARINLAVISPTTDREACVIVLTIAADDGITPRAQEQFSVPSDSTDSGLRRLMAECQQQLLLQLVDQAA